MTLKFPRYNSTKPVDDAVTNKGLPKPSEGQRRECVRRRSDDNQDRDGLSVVRRSDSYGPIFRIGTSKRLRQCASLSEYGCMSCVKMPIHVSILSEQDSTNDGCAYWVTSLLSFGVYPSTQLADPIKQKATTTERQDDA